MATLTETAYYTRRTVKYGSFVLVGLVFLKLIWTIGTSIWLYFFPPPPPPPTLAFGQLPKVNFFPAVVASASAQYTYVLQTVDGKLPVTGPTAKVYFLPVSSVTFGDYDKMVAQASRMGFAEPPRRVAGTANSWHFTDSQLPLRHLDYDATSGNFHLYYDFATDLSIFQQKQFNSPQDMITQATSFFSNLGLLSDDLKSGVPKTSYFKLDSNRLIPTESLADADAVSVSFFRQPVVDGKATYPVVTAEPNLSLVSIMFTGNNNSVQKQVIEVKYYYSPLDRENWATYPIISPSDAFNQLKTGNAYLTTLLGAADANNTITIRSVRLAYFDPFPPQKYLEPVYIFSNEQGFMAFVPAVSDTWTQGQ